MFKVMAIKIEPRNKIAPRVQEILTKYGCIIQTRIGLHEATRETCAPEGLILLNLLNSEKEQIDDLNNELDSLDGVVVKILNI